MWDGRPKKKIATNVTNCGTCGGFVPGLRPAPGENLVTFPCWVGETFASKLVVLKGRLVKALVDLSHQTLVQEHVETYTANKLNNG